MASARQYPFFAAFWNAYHNREFYVNVASSWRWRGVAYLFAVVLVTLLPAALFLSKAIDHFVEEEFAVILPQLPPITVQNGKATVHVEEPYFIAGKSGEKLVAIDTTGKLKTPQEAEARVLVTEQRVLFALHGMDTLPMELSALEDGTVINAASVEHAAAFMQGGGFYMMFIVGCIMTFLFRLLLSVFYALVGTLFVKNMKLDMDFGALYQIALVAQGASLVALNILAFTLAFIGVFPPGALAGVVLAVFLLWFGIKANRDWLVRDLPPLKERF